MTIREYTEQAVRNYLRTVLLVDDQLFKNKTDFKPEIDAGRSLAGIPDISAVHIPSSDHETEFVGQLDEVFSPLEEDPSRNSLDKGVSQSTKVFSPQDVVDGFSRLGIVCGLYQPKTSEFSNGAIPPNLVDLCDHSDVFILDWKLKDNQPNSPVPVLIEQLHNRDEPCGEPRAIRFCAIYTQESLGTVFSILRSEIKTRFPLKTAEESFADYRIRLEGLTIRLYRKTDEPEAANNPKRFVSSTDLAETVVKDFVTEYEGIMSATALRGIAEVRSNAKRILEKFPKGLDSAFVLHAGLTLNEKSIVADIVSLLGDELSSALSDLKVSPDEVYDLCSEFVSSCEDDVFARTSDKVFSGHPTNSSIKQFLMEVFKQKTYSPCAGERCLEPVFKKCIDKKGNFSPSVPLLGTFKEFVERRTKNAKDYVFGALSALFCQRTIYSNQKILQFGTIVRKCSADGNPSQMYYLCLMPTCDSIRLEDDVTDETGVAHPVPHRFPFWELDFVSPEGEHRTHGLYVKVDGQYHSLCAKGKIRDKFHLMDFYSRQKVVPFDESGTLVCVNGDAKLEWIAELKSAHVQRIAERVSREFSRVGLSESEWLRLQVDR